MPLLSFSEPSHIPLLLSGGSMANKQGLIRIQGEENIWYDSDEKVYRYRMHCPNCKVALPCRCYQDLEALLGDIDDGIADFTCSAKCALLIGEWDELDEAMQEAGLTGDLRKCLSKLTNEQLDDVIRGYDLDDVLKALFDAKSNIPFSHLNQTLINREERVEIIFAMGDVKDVLWNHDISYYPEIESLTEDESRKLLDILNDGCDFDMASGEACET